MKTLDLVALGEPLIEFNQLDPARPDFRLGFGGDTSNCVIAAARLGARCAYLTRVGTDTFGEQLLGLWRNEGVDTSGVAVDRDAPTGLYFVTHGPQGHQFAYRRAGSAASRMTPRTLAHAPIAAARWLHCSGVSQAISASAHETVAEAIAVARASGTRVSYDLNFRPRLWPAERALEAALATLAHCDLFLPSVDEVSALTGLRAPEDILHWAHDHGAHAVALKLGPNGCLVSIAGRTTRIEAVAVTPVDATGAGDCFAGACMSQLARGASLEQAARIGNLAAALSTRGHGAVAPLPHRADLLAHGAALA